MLSLAGVSEKLYEKWSVLARKSNGFQQSKTQFILAGIRFCINSLFVQDTVTVVTHKRRQFLKKISTSRKICSPNSNKAFFLKLFSTRRNNWLYFQNRIKVKNDGSFFIDNWFISRRLFQFHVAEKCVTWQGFYLKFFRFHVLRRSHLSQIKQISRETSFY